MFAALNHFISMNQKTEKILFYLFLFVSAITVLFVAVSANASFDAGDGLQHYLIARYSWHHPHLLLDLWGKPFFTLISSPFAQFGLKGMYLFQSLCAVGVSFFSFKIAKKLNLKYAWTVPAFLFFSPIYFAVINTGLAEIFFGFLFMLCVWLIFEQKFILSALLFSFVPFVRPEAYLVLPLIALVFLIRRKFIAIPFLLTSFILYTIIGYFHYHDIWWIITNNYKVEENYLGNKGSFFHFTDHYEDIWGKVYTIFMVLGICSILYSIIRVMRKKAKYDFMPEEVFLILGSFVGCLLLHSLLFSMPGILNNLGMMRYMVVLIPSSAILALKGLNLISFTPLKKYFYIELLTICVFIYMIVKVPFKQWWYPFRVNNEQMVVNEAGKWMDSPNIKNKRTCYLHPQYGIAAEIDPFDDKKNTLLWSLDKEHLNLLPDSTFIVWDSHYAPQEGGLPFKLLSEDTSMVPLKHYKYYDEKYPFEVWVFMKSNLIPKTNRSVVPEIVMDYGLVSNLSKNDSTFFNFDTMTSIDKAMLSKENVASGQTSIKYSPDKEYGIVFAKQLGELKNLSTLRMIEVQFKFFPCDSIKDIIPVIEIKDDTKTIAWYGAGINQQIKINEWNSCKLQQVILPNDIKEKNKLNFYLWNKGKRKFYLDDVTMYYYSLK
jgi:hypothetical protein